MSKMSSLVFDLPVTLPFPQPLLSAGLFSTAREIYRAQQREGRNPKIGPLTKEQAALAALAERDQRSRPKQVSHARTPCFVIVERTPRGLDARDPG